MRTEQDFLGEKQIPAEAYWGIHTARAVENFSFSKRTVHPDLIKAYALVKKACAAANAELGFLAKDIAQAVQSAALEIAEGKYPEQFPIDALQGGAGTSTNMNVNEVIANRALEILGKPHGEYTAIGPLEHVNMHQSTNDTYPTALKIAALFKLKTLSDNCASLQDICQEKEKQYADILILGRTELTAAVPMTLGRVFSGYAEAFGRDRWRTFKCEERIRNTNLGGTAIGTGLTAPRKYIFLVTEKLQQLTGLPVARAENLVDQTMNADSFVEVSGILCALSVNLSKVARDLRLYQLLGEISLPQLQTGSSIMPGKVNPVMIEAILQTTLVVQEKHNLIMNAAAQGSLQINEFLPLIADSLLTMLDLLISTTRSLTLHIEGLCVDAATCLRHVEESPALITALIPQISYKDAEKVVAQFNKEQKVNMRHFLNEKFGTEFVNKMLSPQQLNQLGYK
jgi:aspartate ammonia-lyase